MNARWVRLERYARWKQRRIRLESLPHDVLTIICRFLTNESVPNLLAALQGLSRTKAIGSAQDVVEVPVEIRRRWLRRMAYEHVEGQLKALTHHTCVYCNDVSIQVHAFADWSVFDETHRTRRPIAEYRYEDANGRAEWTMRVNEHVLTRHVDSLCERCVCATRISIYVVLAANTLVYLIPNEMGAFLFLVYPHFLIDHI